MTTFAAPRSCRGRKAAAAACLALSFAAAGSILLPNRADDGAAAADDGSSRILPSRLTSQIGASSLLSSSSTSSPFGGDANGTSFLRAAGGAILGGAALAPPPPRAGHRTIRTFYEPLPHYTPAQRAEQDGQLELWRTAWTDAGWDARILTLEDARRHPRHDEFAARINALDWCGPEERRAEFQKSCFVRWMAYSADGAGYVSDYDILPLSFGMTPSTMGDDAVLPNGGAFTAYDPILASFASSGSGGEYERVLEAMLDAAEEHRKPRRPEDEGLGPAGRRSRGTECPATALTDGPNDEEQAAAPLTETKWQITDMQALQVIKYAMWKGSAPPNILHVPAVHDEDRPPCTFVVNENTFEEWTMDHPGSCPGAVHFSGKAGMERDGRLEVERAMWEDWKGMCRSRNECAVPSREADGKVDLEGKRGVVLNVAAWASIFATAMAAMA